MHGIAHAVERYGYLAYGSPLCFAAADVNLDARVDADDLADFATFFANHDRRADVNGNGRFDPEPPIAGENEIQQPVWPGSDAQIFWAEYARTQAAALASGAFSSPRAQQCCAAGAGWGSSHATRRSDGFAPRVDSLPSLADTASGVPCSMPLYQVTAIDHDRGVRHTAYYEADGSEPISRLLAARGLGVLEIVMVVAVPDGFGIQRISPRRPALRDRDPVLHRLRLMVLGVLIGVALCLGVVFVLKAREHLTRTDIRPNLPTPPTGVATP